MGPTLPLYILLLKLTLILSALLAAALSLLTLYYNSSGTSCDKLQGCTSNQLFLGLSICNKLADSFGLTLQFSMTDATSILIILFLQYIVRRGKEV